MKQRLLKLTLLTLLTAAISGLSIASRADDSTPAAAPATPAKTKFYGPVTAVDTNAMTFTVGAQTFTVTDDSKMTKNGQSATLSDVVVGEPARGSYTTGSDGKLDVTKVRFGKSGGKHKKSTATEGSETSTNAPATPPQQ